MSTDIGISSPDAPDPYGDCTAAETACRKMPTGVQKRLGDTEAPDPILDLLTAYTANLAVPARRDVGEPDVLAGKALFYQAGCATCHTPKFVTARNAPEPQHAFQLIWPYSDLLLHDMGEGLADGQQVGEATGREWRTAPLWGIGLAQTVNGYQAYLHDGRARTLEEAILCMAARASVPATPMPHWKVRPAEAFEISGIIVMKRLVVLLTAASFTALAPAANAAFVSDAEIQPVMQRAVDEVIVPGYSNFRMAAEASGAAMNKLCIANDASSYDGAKKAFADLVSAWSRIEVLRDGPVLDNNMFERILFFPDRKGLALKQIQAMLAAKDESEIAGASMKGKSVAVQGLTGLEYVLSGNGKRRAVRGKDNFRCHAGRAIASNIALLAGELSDAWNAPDGIADKWRKPVMEIPCSAMGRGADCASRHSRARAGDHQRKTPDDLHIGRGRCKPQEGSLLAFGPDAEIRRGQSQGPAGILGPERHAIYHPGRGLRDHHEYQLRIQDGDFDGRQAR